MRHDPVHVAPAWRTWLRAHERPLSLVYLGLVALACLSMAASPARHFILGRLEGLSNRYDRHWDRQLAEGERLVRSRKYVQAIAFLERLDRSYPAPSPQHARDKEREHLLRLLSLAYEGAGHKHKAMDVYDRLIAYDPHDFVNIALKAAAARRLLSGWAIAAEANAAWDSTLKVFPNHLPSVRGRIDYFNDRGEWIPITTIYRAYLNAFLLQRGSVIVGGVSREVPFMVDGKPHVVLVDLPEARAESATVHTGGYPVAIDSVGVMPPQRVGQSRPLAMIVVPGTAIEGAGMSRTAAGAFLPRGDSSMLRIRLPDGAAGGRLRMVVRVFKPVDEDTWDLVSHAYQQILTPSELASDSARSVPFATQAEADAVFARQRWAAPEAYNLAKP